MDRPRRVLLAISSAVLVLVAVVMVTRVGGDGRSTNVSAGGDDDEVTLPTVTGVPVTTTTTEQPPATMPTTVVGEVARSAAMAAGRGWSVRRTSSATEECLEVVAATTERLCGITKPAHVAGPMGIFATPAGAVVVAVTVASVTTLDLSGIGGAYVWAVGDRATDPFLPGVQVITYPMNGAATRATVIFRGDDDPLAVAQFVGGHLGPAGYLFDDAPTFGKRTNYRKVITGLSYGIHEFGVYDGAGGAPCIVFRRLVPHPQDEDPATPGDACLPAKDRKPIEAAKVLPTSKPGFVDIFAAFNGEVESWRYTVAGGNGSGGAATPDPGDPTIKLPWHAGSVVVPEGAESLTLIASGKGGELARVELAIPKHT